MTYLSDWTHQPEERGTIRLLALWLLLEGSEQAISKGSRITEDPVQAEGGQPSGWPPAPALCLENINGNHRTSVFRELSNLLKKEIVNSATPQETRRVAEIFEFLDKDDLARIWWEKAALKGDEDACDYLHILDAENEERLSACNRRGEERTEEAFKSFARSFACRAVGTRVAADKVDRALGEAGTGLSAVTQALVREIEDFLTHLDHTTGGPRC
ncbi:magnesium and cobalt transport protein CorA [Streptomyces fungicidicus]|uniref:hypothetical protein n=1 Tax=Streptomyces fungicidicus TaxID=68203 RepID=UPI00369B7EC5